MKYKCSKCHTEYFEPGECGWCPGEKLHFLAEGPCETQLERAGKRIQELEVKAAKWDALLMTCHRFGVSCQEIIRAINERIRRRS